MKQIKIEPIPAYAITEVSKYATNAGFKCIVISVTDIIGKYPIITSLNTLKMYFADIDKPIEDLILFNTSNALDILNFVKRYLNVIDVIFTQCAAGVSRSPAMAAALSKILYGDDERYFQKFCPNRLIYKTILEANEKFKVLGRIE